MIKNKLDVKTATRLVRSKREIFPNPGFLQQLCDLNEKLKKNDHFDVSGSRHVENLSSALSNVKKQSCTEDDLSKILADPASGLMLLPSLPYNIINDFIIISDRCVEKCYLPL